MRRSLSVYGLDAEVSGEWSTVIENIVLDFAWFQTAGPVGAGAIRLDVEQRPPDVESFGNVPASFVTPRNVVYQLDGRTVVDYFGRAVSIYDRRADRLLIQGEDEQLVHEAAYQFLLSRIGIHLDRLGLTRLHALGMSGRHGAVAVMLPSGGGKSTLAVRALQEEGRLLISEDSPLIDRRGRLHPFPLRVGVNEGDADRLPSGALRRIERMEFHPKLVLDVEAFDGKIQRAPQPLRHLVVGQRTLGRTPTLERIPRRSAVGTLFREAVVGVGIYQGMEFVLQRGMRDVAGKVGTARTRAMCCAAGLARAQVWRLSLGRDPDRNWSELSTLLR